jgi:hypothetical protein
MCLDLKMVIFIATHRMYEMLLPFYTITFIPNDLKTTPISLKYQLCS